MRAIEVRAVETGAIEVGAVIVGGVKVGAIDVRAIEGRTIEGRAIEGRAVQGRAIGMRAMVRAAFQSWWKLVECSDAIRGNEHIAIGQLGEDMLDIDLGTFLRVRRTLGTCDDLNGSF